MFVILVGFVASFTNPPPQCITERLEGFFDAIKENKCTKVAWKGQRTSPTYLTRPEDIELMSDMLGRSIIKNIEISVVQMSSEAASKILAAPKLEILTLWEVGLGNEGGVSLGSGLELAASTRIDKKLKLHTLNIADNTIGDSAGFIISQAKTYLSDHNIDLSDNSISDFTTIATALANNQNIRSLNLASHESFSMGGNRVGDEGARLVADKLPLSGLQKLDLTGNEIRDEGAAALADVLMHSSLKSLVLHDNKIGNRGLLAFIHAIVSNPQPRLRLLVLTRNSIGPEGLQALQKAQQAHSEIFDKIIIDTRFNNFHHGSDP
eukprot:UC4_evm2s755